MIVGDERLTILARFDANAKLPDHHHITQGDIANATARVAADRYSAVARAHHVDDRDVLRRHTYLHPGHVEPTSDRHGVQTDGMEIPFPIAAIPIPEGRPRASGQNPAVTHRSGQMGIIVRTLVPGGGPRLERRTKSDGGGRRSRVGKIAWRTK